MDSLESMADNVLTNCNRNDASSFASSTDVGLKLTQQPNAVNSNHLNMNNTLTIKSDYGLTNL